MDADSASECMAIAGRYIQAPTFFGVFRFCRVIFFRVSLSVALSLSISRSFSNAMDVLVHTGSTWSLRGAGCWPSIPGLSNAG